MTKDAIIDKTVKVLKSLPTEKAEEVADFADFIFKKYEEHILQQGIYKLSEEGQSFNFLNEEEVIYTAKDIKEKY